MLRTVARASRIRVEPGWRRSASSSQDPTRSLCSSVTSFPDDEDRQAGGGHRLGRAGLPGRLAEVEGLLHPIMPRQEPRQHEWPERFLGVLGHVVPVCLLGVAEMTVAFQQFGDGADLIRIVLRVFLEQRQEFDVLATGGVRGGNSGPAR